MLHNEPALNSPESLKAKWCRTHGIDILQERDEKAWQDCLQHLFDAGIIGYQTFLRSRVGNWSSQKIVFSFVNPGAKMPTNRDIAIHPLFWSAYGIKPVNFKIEWP